METMTIQDFGLTHIEREPNYGIIAKRTMEDKCGSIAELMRALTDSEKAAMQLEYEHVMKKMQREFEASIKRAKEGNKMAVSFLTMAELKDLIEMLIAEYGQSGAEYAIAEMSRLGIIDYSIKKTGKGVLVGKKTLGEGTVSPFKCVYKIGRLKGESEFSSYCTRKTENGCWFMLSDIKQQLQIVI